MKKRVFGIFFVMLLSLSLTFLVFAADDVPRLVDEAALLSDSDAEALLGLLDEISERQQMDIVVVTVNSLQGASSMEYADDFYDYNGYGFGEERDGILFLISMEERDWYISTTGYGITVFTDAGLEYISERFLDDLSEGEYAAAFTTFAELCDDFITQADTGEPYDVGNLPKEPFWLVGSLVIALAAGFIIALIATGVMRSQLKTVYSEKERSVLVSPCQPEGEAKRQWLEGPGRLQYPSFVFRQYPWRQGREILSRFLYADHIPHILWQGRGKFHSLSCDRMREGDPM